MPLILNSMTEMERALVLDLARLRASHAMLMQGLATIARKGSEQDRQFIQSVVKAADAASLDVKVEDLVRAEPT